jgi:hypothetical protein
MFIDARSIAGVKQVDAAYIPNKQKIAVRMIATDGSNDRLLQGALSLANGGFSGYLKEEASPCGTTTRHYVTATR